MLKYQPIRRNETIDALRGIAALAVVVGHIFDAAHRESGSALVRRVSEVIAIDYFDWGRFGVVVFFLISGFVVPEFLVRGGGKASFLRQRLLRIFPAFWLSIVVVLLVNWWLAAKSHHWSIILANATLFPNVFRKEWLSGVYWTLNIEVIFYFLCAIGAIFRVLGNFWVVFSVQLGLVALTVIPVVVNELLGRAVLPVQYTSYYQSFLLAGVLMRIYQRTEMRHWPSLALAALPFYFVPLVSGMIFPVPRSFVTHSAVATVVGHAAALFVFVGIVVFDGARLRGWWLRVGESSYSLYLFHWPICAIVISIFGYDSFLGLVITFLLSVALSQLAAKILFRCVELPSIRMGRQI